MRLIFYIFYDSESRITRTLYADSNSIDSEYDQKGRITKRIDQKLDVMTYLYDSRDLLTKKTYGVSGEQTFTWDVMRRKTQDTDNNSNNQLITMGYEFDKLSRMTKQTQKIGSGTTQNVIRYFDTFGHRTRTTYPHSRNVDTTFTALHQVDEIKTDVGAGIVTVANYDYLYDSGLDKRPLVSKNALHSGTDTRVDFAYDSMGRVTKKNWVDISATTTLSGFEYTYDLYGNRLTDNQLDRSQDSHTYHYDSAQRFTKMERGTIGGTPSFYQGYTLDALANWSSFNNNGTTESRSHDVMNAITFRGATSLSHDLNGNLTNDGNQKYIWDELNRLVEVRDSGNNIICDYYYNANNLRVEKHHAGGAKEQFYYDGATVLVETDGSQAKVREYVNGGQYIDEVILVVNGSTYNYYMSDLRYCVTGFIDSTGAVVERARYDGYGKRTLLDAAYATITTANVDQSYGYTGIRHDAESGLQYYRARYFDNTLGRFINHDPLSYVDGLNLYRGYFVPNSIDPFGLKIEGKLTKVENNDSNGYKFLYKITGLDKTKQYYQDGIVNMKIVCTKPASTKKTITFFHKDQDLIWNVSEFPEDIHEGKTADTIALLVGSAECCDEGTFESNHEFDFRRANLVNIQKDGSRYNVASDDVGDIITVTDQSTCTSTNCIGKDPQTVNINNDRNEAQFTSWQKSTRIGDTIISINHISKGSFKKNPEGISILVTTKPKEENYK